MNLHCVPKNIPNIFNCNFDKDYRISIILDVSIPETTSHQISF